MAVMRIRYMMVAALGFGAFALPLSLQAQDAEKKPGGVNKVARNLSKTMKKAGRDTKAEVKRDASKTHQALTTAGKDTKSALKKATGVTSRSPDAEHKSGGLNKIARDVSHASKKAGAKTKHAVKSAAGSIHED